MDTDGIWLLMFAISARNWNKEAVAEGAALVMQPTVVRSAVLTGTVHPRNVATRK